MLILNDNPKTEITFSALISFEQLAALHLELVTNWNLFSEFELNNSARCNFPSKSF